jgi:tRNA nucleotidyltransferase/poly(A) polymerase
METLLRSASEILDPLIKACPDCPFWLVGGSVRDLLLDRIPFDYDIAVKGNPAHFAAAVAGRIGGRPVSIGPKGKRIHRLATENAVFDISRLAGNSIDDDLLRRDFTVNAMAFDPVGGKTVDPLGGRKDLQAGQIRMVSDQAFRDDPLRLVRAFRISAMLGLTLESETESCLRRFVGLIKNSAGERVRDELCKLLSVERSEKTLRHMDRCGLLGTLLPELAALRGCRQGGHHQFDALTHTLMVVEHLESLLADPLPQLGRCAKEPAILGLRQDPVPIKMAALLHDIGKPAARGKTADERIHFRGHSMVGYRAAQAVFERLHLPNRHRRFIGHLIRQHIRPLQLFIAHQRGGLTPKGRTRFFLRCGAMTPAVLLLSLADMAGKRELPDDRFTAFSRFVDDLLGAYFSDFSPKESQPPLIDGRDLIEGLGLSPSPLFGMILSRIEAERLEGRLKTRDEAMARARELAGEYRNDGMVD